MASRDRLVNISFNFSINGISSERVILGTHLPGTEANYLYVVKINLPEYKPSKEYSKETINKYSSLKNKIEIEYKINHQGEVNKARPMPQKNMSHIIATKTSTNDVLIYDYLKHPKEPVDNQIKPELKLTGHTKEGFGLSWSYLHEGYLLSGSDDHRICLWDINNTSAPLLKTMEEHKSVVEDVNFSKQMDGIFVSCGDDRKMMIWDIRQNYPIHCVEAHIQEVNSAEFNPFNEYLILTASNDKSCALWDLRNLNMKLCSFKHHKNDVIAAKWNPNIMSMFASFSSDRRINIWDLSNIGKDTETQNNVDGPSELLFTHGGHTSRVSDFDWNPNSTKELLCASVSDDNIIQIWEMAECLYYGEEGSKNKK
ncbi:MAG: hypothetical protein MJ252_25220 [archaeon]|nr:hypothetical protein [archaeon]